MLGWRGKIFVLGLCMDSPFVSVILMVDLIKWERNRNTRLGQRLQFQQQRRVNPVTYDDKEENDTMTTIHNAK